MGPAHTPRVRNQPVLGPEPVEHINLSPVIDAECKNIRLEVSFVQHVAIVPVSSVQIGVFFARSTDDLHSSGPQ
eukprot:3015479-Pyramimonas_sp.AAC.1